MCSPLLVQPGPTRPSVRLSPLASAIPLAPSEASHSAVSGRTMSYASTPTAVHPSPHSMFTQMTAAAPGIQSFIPQTQAFSSIQAIQSFFPQIHSSIPAPAVFPPEEITQTHTTASYSTHPILELVNSDKGHWAFSLDIPIPNEMTYPTLTSLDYTVKYGTEHAHGPSAMRTSIKLTKIAAGSDAKHKPTQHGIIIDPPSDDSDHSAVGLPSQTFDGLPVVCLSSVPTTKEHGHTDKWDHHTEKQQIHPYVRIIEDSHLHLYLDVTETPSTQTQRSLSVEVSATWIEDMQGKAVHVKMQAAATRIQDAEQKKASEEQARLQAEHKSAEAKWAEEAAKRLEAVAKKKSEADQLATKHENEHANADRLVKHMADALAETHRLAKEAADGITQRHLAAGKRAEQRAEAEHQAEVAAEARAHDERKAISEIKRQRILN